MNVSTELHKVLGLKGPKSSEDAQDYLAKIVRQADKLSDAQFGDLSKEAQEWIESAIDAVENKKDIEPPAGFGNDEKSTKGKPNGKHPPAKAAKGKEKEKSAKGDKPAKKAKGKKGEGKGGVGRVRKYTNDQKITIIAKENPKRPGTDSYKRFAKYKKGMTVAEALAAGVTSGDLNWDVKHSYISIK